MHQKVIKCLVENSVFLFSWGFKMRMEMSFMDLEVRWLFGSGKLLEIFLKEFARALTSTLLA